MGRLVQDPETRMTQSNIAMCRFKIAVNRPTKKGEEKQADFFQITAWRQTAEFVQKYFTKGQQVLIEGYLRNNSWTDQQGNKRYADEVHAEQVYFADSKRDNTGPAQQAPQAEQHETYGGYLLGEDDEDLPF